MLASQSHLAWQVSSLLYLGPLGRFWRSSLCGTSSPCSLPSDLSASWSKLPRSGTSKSFRRWSTRPASSTRWSGPLTRRPAPTLRTPQVASQRRLRLAFENHIWWLPTIMILTPASAMELILMIGIKNFPSFNYLIPTKILRYLVHFSWYYEKTMSSLPLLTFRISKVFKSLVVHQSFPTYVEAWFHVPEFGWIYWCKAPLLLYHTS